VLCFTELEKARGDALDEGRTEDPETQPLAESSESGTWSPCQRLIRAIILKFSNNTTVSLTREHDRVDIRYLFEYCGTAYMWILHELRFSKTLQFRLRRAGMPGALAILHKPSSASGADTRDWIPPFSLRLTNEVACESADIAE
jgi:hypothetical protein